MNFANYINNRTIDLYELFSRPSKKMNFDDGKIYQNIHIAVDETKLNSKVISKHSPSVKFSQKDYIIEPKIDKKSFTFTINDVDNQLPDELTNLTYSQESGMASNS